MTPEMSTLTRTFAAVMVALGVASAGHAQEEPLADRTNKLRAQVELLNLEAELQRALTRNVSPELSALPKIIAIYGMESKLQARLLLSGGMVSTFAEGDTIRSTMKVVAITPKSVVVRITNGQKSAALPLDFISSGQTGAPGGLPGLGGMPSPLSGSPLPPELLPSAPSVGGPVVAPRPAAAAAPAAQATAGAAPAAQGAPAR